MATPLRRTQAARPGLGILLALLLSALLVGGTAGTAQAAGGYKYWNYFHVKNGTYVFASSGPGDYTPKDGATEAWRFGTSTTQQGIKPRADLDTYSFSKVCASTKPKAGQKRVAVLIDYGTAADAAGAAVKPPRAACAQVPTSADGQQVIAAVAQVRQSKGMTCALDGYPASGCGEPVKNAKVPAHEQNVTFALPKAESSAAAKPVSQQDNGSSTPLLVGGIVVVVLIAGGAFAISRRNRTT